MRRQRLAGVLFLTVLVFPPAAGRAQTTSPAQAIDALYPELAALYEDLHRNPELAFQEKRTAATLAARLKSLGYEVTTGVGGTGIVALLRNGPGPTAMLRTELDALPVAEKTGAAFASTVTTKNAAGQLVPVMHACGHDLHMAAWTGTAAWMAGHRQLWKGTLMLVGQPAEETVSGAAAMLKDGLFTRFPKPDFVIGLHDDDTLPAGTIGYHAGFFRASMAAPVITIAGRGGHGAVPQNTVDPIVIAARTIMSLQTIVARENNPLEPLVVTIGSIHGGTQGNIIPDQVRMELSVRTFSEDVRKRALSSIERIAKAEALAAGAPREPTIEFANAGIGPVFNDPSLTGRLATALRAAMGPDRVVDMPAKMTSEDFAEYGRAGVPAVLLHIGAVAPARLEEARRTGNPVPAPHSPEWLPALEPTLKGAVQAETAALIELLQ
ncbi:MAG: amidohydrolase [Vicinamibacterales bacterium]